MKKWLLRILLALVLLVVLAVALVEINREKIAAAAVDAINQQITGTFTYHKADVSLLRTFPFLGIRLIDIELHDNINMADDRLIQGGDFILQLNLWSAIMNREHIIIRKLEYKDGLIKIKTFKNGTNNYTLFADEEESEETTGTLDIESFFISNTRILYIDEMEATQLSLNDLNIKGDIKLNQDQMLISSAVATQMVLQYGRMIPRYELALAGNTKLKTNTDYSTIEMTEGDFTVNSMPISSTGSINEHNSGYNYNFNIEAKNASIAHLIALIPGTMKQEVKGLKAQGSLSLTANINGHTADPYPQYDLKISADGRAISYPTLPKRIEQVRANIHAINKSKNLPYQKVEVKNLDIKIDQSFIKGDIIADRLGSRELYSLDVEAKFDLADWSASVPMVNDLELLGKLDAGIKAAFEADASNNIHLSQGKTPSIRLGVRDFKMIEKQKTTTSIESLNATSSEGDLAFDLRNIIYYDAVNVARVDGHINDILSLAAGKNDILRGEVNVLAGLIDLETLPVNEEKNYSAIPNIDISGKFKADEIRQNGYIIKGVSAEGNLNNGDSRIRFSVDDLMGNTFSGTGMFENILGYGLNGETLVGSLDLRSQRFSLDPFMQDADQETDQSEELIPANLALAIEYSVDQLKFKNFDLSSALGEILLADRSISLHNEAKIFGGKIEMTMNFDGSHSDIYGVDLSLNLVDLGFSETAQNTNLFNQLLPIAPFLKGKYNSVLNWKSSLSKDFIPNLNTITAYGEMLTKGASISSLEPIKEVVNRFTNADDSGAMLLRDVNRYFAVNDGKVRLDPTIISFKDLDFNVSGTHSFTQLMDYTIVVDIPFSKINLDKLLSEAQTTLNINRDWLKVAPDTKIQLELAMDGNIKSPSVRLKDVRLKTGNIVSSAAAEIERRAVEEKEKIESKVRDTIKTTISKVEDRISDVKDSLRGIADSTINVVRTKVDSTRSHYEAELEAEKDKIVQDATAIIDSIKAGNIDSIGAKIQDRVQDIKDRFKITLPKRKTD